MKFDFLNNDKIQLMFSLFQEAGEELYVVGGIVRNELCGLVNDMSDIDLSTPADPDKVSSILKKNNISFSSIGKMFGTITATVDDSRIDITSLRKDAYGRSRYPQVQYTDSIEKDSKRRDFTINALYVDRNGKLFDYHYGLRDIRERIVRYIVEPSLSVKVDPLRILRYFRFCSLYFWENIDEEAFKVSAKNFDKTFKLGRKKFLYEWEKILDGYGARTILLKMDEFDIVKKVNRFIQNGKASISDTDRLFWD